MAGPLLFEGARMPGRAQLDDDGRARLLTARYGKPKRDTHTQSEDRSLRWGDARRGRGGRRHAAGGRHRRRLGGAPSAGAAGAAPRARYQPGSRRDRGQARTARGLPGDDAVLRDIDRRQSGDRRRLPVESAGVTRRLCRRLVAHSSTRIDTRGMGDRDERQAVRRAVYGHGRYQGRAAIARRGIRRGCGGRRREAGRH